MFCCVDNHKRIDVLVRTAGGFAQSLEKYGQVTIDSLEINSAAIRICSYSRSFPTRKREPNSLRFSFDVFLFPLCLNNLHCNIYKKIITNYQLIAIFVKTILL